MALWSLVPALQVQRLQEDLQRKQQENRLKKQELERQAHKNPESNRRRVGHRIGDIGVLFDCFGRKIDGNSWFTWWFNHLPGPSISPKRTPMIGELS